MKSESTTFKITDEMRKIRKTKGETLDVIRCELYRQKFNRPPTLQEYFGVRGSDTEIEKTTAYLIEYLFPNLWGGFA